MNETDWLAERFEEHRPHLRTVAYRMLGSANETEDAVQEAWIRLSRTNGAEVDNLGGWLTTVVGRVCLDMLRQRRSRPEDAVGAELPEPVVVARHRFHPSSLHPDAERAARVRAARHVRRAVRRDRPDRRAQPRGGASAREPRPAPGAGAAPRTAADLTRQRTIVDAFLAAARAADFEGLLAVLDPDVVFKLDRGARSRLTFSGISVVAEQIMPNAHTFAPLARPAIVNGAAGLIGSPERPLAICSFGFEDDRIAEIDLVLDPEKLPGRS